MFSLINVSPQAATLKPHIEYYYFLRSDETNKLEHFIHYPDFRTTANTYRRSTIILENTGRSVQYDATAPPRVVVTHNYERFLEAKIKGPCEVIGVGFKPLGINHFIHISPSLAYFLKRACFLTITGARSMQQ